MMYELLINKGLKFVLKWLIDFKYQTHVRHFATQTHKLPLKETNTASKFPFNLQCLTSVITEPYISKTMQFWTICYLKDPNKHKEEATMESTETHQLNIKYIAVTR